MFRVGVGFVLAFAALGAAPVCAQMDPMGTLTFDGSGGTGERHVILLGSLFFNVAGGRQAGADPSESRTLTVTSTVTKPDPALIDWLTGPDKKRQVRVEIKDDPDVPPRSVIRLEGAALMSWTVGYGDSTHGTQTMEISAEHMTIDGQPVY